MGGMDSIIAEFLAESFENLDLLDQDLVNLEKHPDDLEVFARIFRTIHTIKGTCGFLAFQKLEAVAHAGESLLARLRDGTLSLRPEITTDLLVMIDAVRTILSNIDRNGSEGDTDYADLIARLQALEATEKTGGKADATAETASPAAGGPAKKRKPRATKKTAARPAANSAAAEGGRSGKAQSTEPAPPAAGKPDPSEAGPPEGVETLELTSIPAAAESNIRVDVRVLDHLMNLVGELVLARNQLVQRLAGINDARLAASSQRLDNITGQLQEAVMRTRMQPISSIWQKLPRFVRDLALNFGKEVEIEMEGEETDLDKSVIEAIKGSLLHLVRNAVDHGIEAPDVREAQGKPRVGTLRLRAHHEGGNVVIEVRDDGRGLDRERIVKRAVTAGLVDEEKAEELTAREIESFVFQPGFSTASKVTNVSGRGVGLDVVRANVESLGGSIELQSEPGESTTFRLKIPLTLAIVSVLLSSAGRHRIAIPQASVVELVRLDGNGGGLGIEDLNGVPVYRLRGKLLPLVDLNHELDIRREAPPSSTVNIVVLQGDDRRFGLIVDSIEDSQEIVVKPLGHLLAGGPFAGATILGDGQIALILDVFRLGLSAGVVSETRAHSIASQVSSAVAERPHKARLVALQGPGDERMAIDFDVVTRLEHFPRTAIEWVGDRQLVQYGELILQLIDLQSALPERRQRARDSVVSLDDQTVPVVVCTVNGRLVGLIAHRILDIVDESLKARKAGSREGVRACAVIQDRVTEILDLEKVVRLSDPGFFDRETEGA
jgi:two-component system chemotaxis sensor kinase CheA